MELIDELNLHNIFVQLFETLTVRRNIKIENEWPKEKKFTFSSWGGS